MLGCCAVIHFVASANCYKSCMLTPFFLAPAVTYFIILLIKLTGDVKALMPQYAWLIVGTVVCQKTTVPDNCSALVFFRKMLSVQ